MNFWNNFAAKHPAAAKWVREGGLFVIVSNLKMCIRDSLWVTRTISLLEAGYVCARAFVLAELAASAEWQLHCFLSVSYTHLDVYKRQGQRCV